MSIAREDATRIVRFCLAGVGWGSALHEDDLCVLKIARSAANGTQVQRFEAASFEAALWQAADAGVLKRTCVEKQIAFLARALTARDLESTDRVPIAAADKDRIPVDESFFAAITAAISAVIHETQRERGISSLYLSSGGCLFSAELRTQWQATDARNADLTLVRRRYGAQMVGGLAHKLDRWDELLAGLCSTRSSIESLQVLPAQVIERFSNANGELLSVIDGLARTGVATLLRSTALAWMALLHGKEKTGIERAQLATAFTRDRFAEGQHATVAALIAASESYLHVFNTAAPRAAGDLLRKQLHSEVAGTVTKMEHLALDKREGGFGVDPIAWFATMTQKMDLLVEVESIVHGSLISRPGW